MTPKDLFDKIPKVSRDSLLFMAGLVGIWHETTQVEQERTSLLILFATMVGLPAFLRSDEKRTSSSSDSSPEGTTPTTPSASSPLPPQPAPPAPTPTAPPEVPT